MEGMFLERLTGYPLYDQLVTAVTVSNQLYL